LGPVAEMTTALQSAADPVITTVLPGMLKLMNIFLRNPR
jgi:hypothetical protein